MRLLLYKIQYHEDQQAFKQFYNKYFFRLFQFSYSYVRSKENAEEIVNDVFLSIWQKRTLLDTINNLNVYLYVAVKNASLNCLRKNNLPEPVPIDDLSVHHLHMACNPESVLINRELQIGIRNAIELLPPRCRLIFKLVKEDGLSYKEVALILEISVKTVDTQLYLALKKLSLGLKSVWFENYEAPLTSIRGKNL